MTGSPVPSLVGVIHLPPLPASPRYGGDLPAIVAAAAADARVLAEAGFDGVIIENYGDAPFLPGSASPVTVATLTACALAVRAATPGLPLGVNVLRNDAEAALAIALAVDAAMIRVNVHIGARLTDQGVIEGRAHHTLRLRQDLSLSSVKLLCDVAVKHSAPLAPRPLAEEASDLVERGLADAVLLTGSGTGRPVDEAAIDEVRRAVAAPILLASGMTVDNLSLARHADGVIVGSCLRRSGRAGEPIDAEHSKAFAEAYRRARN